MEFLTLTIGILVGIFVGIVLNSRQLKKKHVGTLFVECSDPLYPDIYLQLNQDASLIPEMESVLMDVKVIDVPSQK